MKSKEKEWKGKEGVTNKFVAIVDSPTNGGEAKEGLKNIARVFFFLGIARGRAVALESARKPFPASERLPPTHPSLSGVGWVQSL